MPSVAKVGQALGKSVVAVVLAGPVAGAREAANSAIDLFWTAGKAKDPLRGLADEVAAAVRGLAEAEGVSDNIATRALDEATGILTEHGLTAEEFASFSFDSRRATDAVLTRAAARLRVLDEAEDALCRRAVRISYDTIGGRSAELPALVSAYQRQVLKDLRAVTSSERKVLAQRAAAHTQLLDPVRKWDAGLYPSSALLRAEYCVVPFWGRTDLLAELADWAQDRHQVALRLYSGAGGMGKTRLMIHLCRQLRGQGWRTGFVSAEADRLDENWLAGLGVGVPGVFLVLDYSETRIGVVTRMVDAALAAGVRVRVVLLARSVADWWYELRQLRNHVGDFLAGPRVSSHELAPLARTAGDRREVYVAAVEAFTAALDSTAQPLPEPDLTGDDYDRVLFLHMGALSAVTGDRGASGAELLDLALRREQRFWDEGLTAAGLEMLAGRPVRQAAALITLAGSAKDHAAAVEVLRRAPLLDGQPAAVLAHLAELFHRLYPADTWLGGVAPDLLGEHLVGAALVDDPALLGALGA